MTNSLIPFYATGFLAISQLLFMGVSSGTYQRHYLVSKLLALYSCCLISYIILMMPAVQSGPLAVSQVFRAFAILTPAVFWVLSFHLFSDRGRVHALVWVLIASYVVVRLITAGLLTPYYGASHWLSLTAQYSTQFIMLGFAGHACYLALRDVRSDLVESRKRMRPIFIISMGAIISVILASGFFYFTDHIVRSFYFLVIFFFTFYFNMKIFRPHQDFLDFIRVKTQSGRADRAAGGLNRADAMTLQRIRTALYEDSLYTQFGLTIKDLSQAVNIKEHQLRRFINQKLHYRNFNEFINECRMASAVRILQDPGQECVQISTIALDLGYSSPSSFNKVFKDSYGMTPSEYRKQAFLEPANEVIDPEHDAAWFHALDRLASK